MESSNSRKVFTKKAHGSHKSLILVILFGSVIVGTILYSVGTKFELGNFGFLFLFVLILIQMILLIPNFPSGTYIFFSLSLIFCFFLIFFPNFYFSFSYLIALIYSSNLCSGIRYRINKYFFWVVIVFLILQILSFACIFSFNVPILYLPYLITNITALLPVQTIINGFQTIDFFISSISIYWKDLVLVFITVCLFILLYIKYRKYSPGKLIDFKSDFPAATVVNEKIAGFLFAVFIFTYFGFYIIASFPLFALPIIFPLEHTLLCSFWRFPAKEPAHAKELPLPDRTRKHSSANEKTKQITFGSIPKGIIPCLFSLYSTDDWLLSKNRQHLVIQSLISQHFSAVFQLDDSFGIAPEDLLFGKDHYLVRYATQSGGKAKALQRIAFPGFFSLYFIDAGGKIQAETYFEPLLDVILKKFPEFKWFMVVDDDTYFRPFDTITDPQQLFPQDDDENSNTLYVYGQSYDIIEDFLNRESSSSYLSRYLSTDLISPIQDYAYTICSKYIMSPYHSHGTGTIFPRIFLKETLLPALASSSIVEDLNLSLIANEKKGIIHFLPQCTMRGEACKDIDSLRNQILRWRNGTFIELLSSEKRVKAILKKKKREFHQTNAQRSTDYCHPKSNTHQIDKTEQKNEISPEKSHQPVDELFTKEEKHEVKKYQGNIRKNADWFVSLTSPILLIGITPIMAMWPLQGESILSVSILTIFIFNIFFYFLIFSTKVQKKRNIILHVLVMGLSIGAIMQISESILGLPIDKNQKFFKTKKYKGIEKNPIIAAKFPWFAIIFLLACFLCAEISFLVFFYVNWALLIILSFFYIVYLASTISRDLDLYRNQQKLPNRFHSNQKVIRGDA